MFLIRNGLKQGDAPIAIAIQLAYGYAIRRVQVSQDGLELIGTHHLLAYIDDVNILGRIVHALKENAERLLVLSKEILPEVNAD